MSPKEKRETEKKLEIMVFTESNKTKTQKEKEVMLHPQSLL